MAGRDDAKSGDKGLTGDAQELWQLVVGYAKQETIDPIRNLGRFLAFGMGGALLLSLGTVLLLLGGLRLLQTETGEAFDGRLTWVPYVIVLLVGGAVAGGALRARNRDQRGRDRER
ncbi:MAG: hypothetical protein M3203_06390 [Actinomycetota bacterium]|nr:hypothetical protein [Actinomycetota bacterium]